MLVAEVGGGRQAWGGPADSHGKVDAGWVRGLDNEGGSGDRWIGASSMGGSQHQRGGGGPSGYGSHGGHSSNVTSSSVGNNIYMTSGPPQSNSMMMSGGGMSRQQDTRFNIAAITARRF